MSEEQKAPEAAPQPPAQPVAWLIVGIVHGMERRTVALHNAIADFRELWGDETTSTPLYAAPPAPAQTDDPHRVPDDVWEALQRLIENGELLGPASREDAMTVSRWRKRFHAAREGAAPAQPDDPWRDAVEDALVTCHLGTVETFGSDPARCLHELLAWHQQVVLDPAVSLDAQALIDRGRDDAAAIVRQLVEALETCRIRSVSEWGVRHVTPIMITGAIKAGYAWLEGK